MHIDVRMACAGEGRELVSVSGEETPKGSLLTILSFYLQFSVGLALVKTGNSANNAQGTGVLFAICYCISW